MFDLNQDPGIGELNLRAYVAALVGPRRILFGQHATKRVPAAPARKGITLYKSTGTGKQATFVELWLPQSSIAVLGGGGVFLALANNDQGASQSAYQILLSATQRFQCVLLDDDALYAVAVTDATGAALPPGGDVAVDVTAVVF